MIELTQEQWQAIAQEENPTAIEPASGAAYVVVLKSDYDKLRAGEAEIARVLRVAWMRRMRLDEEEIADLLRDDPPKNMESEMLEMRALDRLDKITPSGEVLNQFAVKY